MAAFSSRVWMLTLALMMTFSARDAARSQSYQPRSSYLTMGNAAAGRKAFLKLKCNTCHAVAGEAWKPPVLPGPRLGNLQAVQPPEQLADSIVVPGHMISEKPGPWHGPSGSNMGDYTNVMTVRQLIDLIAYLRSR